MSIKFRLTILNFLELFVFGAWLISLGSYLGGQLHFEGIQMAIAELEKLKGKQ